LAICADDPVVLAVRGPRRRMGDKGRGISRHVMPAQAGIHRAGTKRKGAEDWQVSSILNRIWGCGGRDFSPVSGDDEISFHEWRALG